MKYYIAFALCLGMALQVNAQFSYYQNDVLYSWAHEYESFSFEGRHFRLKYPNDFDSLAQDNKKYPLIVFLHGSGERGTNNEKQLVHGGRKTLNAINSGEFPGLALYPQVEAGVSWGGGNLDKVKNIIDELIDKCKVDPNRIYLHGLSLGAEGVWRFAGRHPTYFAAIHPMSGVVTDDPGNGLFIDGPATFIPIWLSQGGRDRNPTPGAGNNKVNTLRDLGANIRYSYYSNLGHGTWNTQYNQPDFFSWFLEKNKTDITVLYGQSEFCPGDNIDITLGVSLGFQDYQWVKDDTTSTSYIASGAASNTIDVTEVGKYYVRFQRQGGAWTNWSKPVDVNYNLRKSASPTVEVRDQSLNLPTLSGQQAVTIYGPENQPFYRWLKDGNTISGANSDQFVATNSGSYALSLREAEGSSVRADGVTPTEFRPEPQACFSEPSEAVVLTSENGYDVPARPANFSVYLETDNSARLEWSDNSSNELAFEIYRSTTSGSGYSLIRRLVSDNLGNPVNYIDEGLMANTIYYYRIRAVNNSGGSDYTVERAVSTAEDAQAPAAPVLRFASATNNSISIEWDEAVDNIGVKEYQIFRDGTQIAISSNLNYTNGGLSFNQVYSYYVKAVDFEGNISSASNQITAAAANTAGVNFEYYHLSGNIGFTSQIASNGTLVEEGIRNNFNISPRQQDERFGFIFTGFIKIETGGNYTFYTSSDDGSMLYINGDLVVNNDTPHGNRERQGQITLTEGFHDIRVEFFENGGGENLDVRWNGPGFSKQDIPDEVLFNAIPVQSAGPIAPTNLSATNITNREVTLSWVDESTDENNFEIWKSSDGGSNFVMIQQLPANSENYIDENLEGSQTYFYQIRAINNAGGSSFLGPISVSSQADPSAPAAPSAITFSNVLANQLTLSWSDNSSSETGFEIFRSLTPNNADYLKIAEVEANITTFLDQQVSGNTTYYYKVRAIGDGNFSSFSNAESTVTDNSTPTIEPIINRSVQFGTTATISVSVIDADDDPITINLDQSTPDNSSFLQFVDNGFGQAELQFSPVEADTGSYTIVIEASDVNGGSATESFVVIISDNENPIIDPIDDIVMTAGFTETVEIYASDSESSHVNLTTSNLPDFVSVVTNTSGYMELLINPDIIEAGVYGNIKILADDGEGGFSEETFTLTVNDVKRNYSVLVNFGATQAPAPWNNNIWDITENNIIQPIILNSNDGEDAMVFQIIDNWFNDNRSVTTSSSLYPTEVVSSGGWKKNGLFEFDLRGLNPALTYDISILTASDSDEYGTLEIIIDGETKSQDPEGNLDQLIEFTGIKSTSSGEIHVRMPRNPGRNTIINAMVVNVYYDDGIIPAAPTNLQANGVSSTEIEVSWQDNSNNEQRFEVYRSLTLNQQDFTLVASVPLNQTTFVDQGLVGNTTYYYQVRAKNATGSTSTSISSGSTLNSPPVIDQINDQNLIIGQQSVITVNATDAEGDALTFSSERLPDFVQFQDNNDGTAMLTINPGINNEGFYGNLKITVSDNFNNADETVFSLQVRNDAYAEQVNINVGSNFEPLPGWTSLDSQPTTNNTFTDLEDIDQINTGISLQVGSGWSSAANDGLSSGNNSFIIEDEVISSYWSSSSSNASLTLSGLDPAANYRFELLASSSLWEDAKADYTIGSITRRFDASRNKEEFLIFAGIQPNSSGEITIDFSKVGNTQDNNFYLNAIILKKYGTQLLFPVSDFEVASTEKDEIRLSWVDNSVNESGYELYYTDEIGKEFTLLATLAADSEAYTHTGLSPDQAFIYKIRSASASEHSDFSSEVAAATISRRVYLNFLINASDYNQASGVWNNLLTPIEDGTVYNNLEDDAGNTSPFTLTVVDKGDGGYNKNGPQPTDNSGIYPNEVLQAYYYLEPNTFPLILDLGGLDLNNRYDLTFFGSHGSLYSVTDYRADSREVTLYNTNNLDRTATIGNIIPSNAGTVQLSAEVANEFEALYGFFNSLVITEQKSAEVLLDKLPPQKPLNLTASNVTDSTFDLNWTPAGDNIGVVQYEVFMNGNSFTIPSTPAYLFQNLDANKEYVVSVRAIDANGNFSQHSDALIVRTLENSNSINYYSLGSDLNSLSNWNSASDGSGNAPTSFAVEDANFLLGHNATLSSNLTLSGSGSRLIIEPTIELVLNADLDAEVELKSNALLRINTSSSPRMAVMDHTSTVEFTAATNLVPSGQYGNIVFTQSNSAKTLEIGQVVVEGNLTATETINLEGSSDFASSLIIKSDINLQNIQTPQSDRMLSLVLAAQGNQVLTTSSNSFALHNLEIKAGTQVVMNSPAAVDINLGTSTGGGLIIEEGGSFNLADNNLQIVGSGTINGGGQRGEISANGGSISVNSNANTESFLYFSENENLVKELSLNLNRSGRVNLSSKVEVSDFVKITDGILESDSTLILLSEHNNSAYIAEIENRGRIEGKIVSQKHMRAMGKRAYHFMAPTLMNTSVANWQETIPITGSFSGASTGAGLGSSASVFYYDESNPAGWVAFPPADNLETFEVGRGYAVFVREANNDSNLELIGEVHQGDFSFQLNDGTGSSENGGDGWNLISNPYPASIQWDDVSWTSQGVGSTVAVWDPEAGGYSYYDYDISIDTGNVFGGQIAQGQAFYVQAFQASPELTVTESAKVNSKASEQQRSSNSLPFVSIGLSNSTNTDYTYVKLTSEGTLSYSAEKHAMKRQNEYFNLSTMTRDSVRLAVHNINPGECESIIPIVIDNAMDGDYQLTFGNLSSLSSLDQVWLIDKEIRDSLLLNEGTIYEFSISEQNQFDLSSRFQLHFNKQPIITDIAITSTQNQICQDSGPLELSIENTQPEVLYSVLINETAVGIEFIGTGNAIYFEIGAGLLLEGSNKIEILASNGECKSNKIDGYTAVEKVALPTLTELVSSFSFCSQDEISIDLEIADDNLQILWFNQPNDNAFIGSSAGGSIELDSVNQTRVFYIKVQNEVGCSSIDFYPITIQINDLIKPEISQPEEGLLESNYEDGNQWFFNGEVISNANSSVLQISESGTYQVQVTQGSCSEISERFKVVIEEVISSVSGAKAEALMIYPNPADDIIYLESQSGFEDLESILVVDLSGKVVQNEHFNKSADSRIELNIRELNKGIYLLRLEYSDHYIHQRIIIE